MRIARKECKEIIHWLDFIKEANPEFASRMKDIAKEVHALIKRSN